MLKSATMLQAKRKTYLYIVFLIKKDPSAPTTPPQLTQKKSVRGKPEETPQEKEKSNNGAGSDEKASSTRTITDSIDALLGGLSSDMEKIGVRTAAKGHCAFCHKSIVGKVQVRNY